MKKRSVWFLSVICLLLLAACEKEPQAVKVTGISVNPTSLSLVEGETGSLTATVSPSDADDKTVIWDSSDKSVASVENGKVTALKAGSANITVKSVDGGFTASCSVSVSAKTVDVASISLSTNANGAITAIDPEPGAPDRWTCPESTDGSYLHHSAKWEMRAYANEEGHGNQACYDEHGRLITDGISGGTADFVPGFWYHSRRSRSQRRLSVPERRPP